MSDQFTLACLSTYLLTCCCYWLAYLSTYLLSVFDILLLTLSLALPPLFFGSPIMCISVIRQTDIP
ncbi:hypothetical protein F5X96DRAFT_634345 [Biscogniauxia mediterranea]|nr:hypothetical protein F5X96DRAFT_634345 [Biscogniauxia mediterranea]